MRTTVLVGNILTYHDMERLNNMGGGGGGFFGSLFGSLLGGGKQSAPAPAPAPAPVAVVSKASDVDAKAQDAVDKKRRASLLSGGNTNLTRGAGSVDASSVGQKQLLGQ